MTWQAELEDLIGPGKVRRDMASLDPGLDFRNLEAGLMVLPESLDDVVAVVRVCCAHGIAMVPQGGRTGLAGGAVSCPGQVIISLQRLNRIVKIDPESGVAVVEAGVTLQALDEACASHGLAVGVDLGARGSATIGGMISTNAGGIEAFRHGTMRSRVLGAEAVVAGGEVVSDLAEVLKCNEGYDVKQLFIGAEGTLGIVTKAALKLVGRPRQRATALVATATAADGLALFSKLQGQGLLAFEMMSGRYFRLLLAAHGEEALAPLAARGFVFVVEIEGTEAGLADLLAETGVADAVLAKSEQERSRFWRLREDSWAVDRTHPHGLWYDVSVPALRIDGYLSELQTRVAAIAADAQVFAIGHLGDGNLHLTITSGVPLTQQASAISAAVYSGLKAMRGSFSAEHGIGLEKREALARYGDSGKLQVMKAVKSALDPAGVFNPGKVLEAGSGTG